MHLYLFGQAINQIISKEKEIGEIQITEKLSVLQPAKYDRLQPTNNERKQNGFLKHVKTTSEGS